MSDEFYKLHLGVRIDGTTNVAPEDKFLAVRPDLSGSIFVLNKKLEFYAGLNGGRKLLRFSEIVEENPFYSCTIASGFLGRETSNSASRAACAPTSWILSICI